MPNRLVVLVGHQPWRAQVVGVDGKEFAVPEDAHGDGAAIFGGLELFLLVRTVPMRSPATKVRPPTSQPTQGNFQKMKSSLATAFSAGHECCSRCTNRRVSSD